MKASAKKRPKVRPILWVLPSGRFYGRDHSAKSERALYENLKDELIGLTLDIIRTPHCMRSTKDFRSALSKVRSKLRSKSRPQFLFAYSRGAEIFWEILKSNNCSLKLDEVFVWGNPIDSSVSLPKDIKRLQIVAGENDLISYCEDVTLQPTKVIEPVDYLKTAVSLVRRQNDQAVRSHMVPRAGHILPESKEAVRYLKKWIKDGVEQCKKR